MRKQRTASELRAEAHDLKLSIRKGKLKGKAKAKAQARIYSLAYHAKSKEAKALKSIGTGKKLKQAKLKSPKVNPNQMILPGFLGQMDTVRIEEMFRERLTKAMDQRINSAVEEVLSKVLPLKKAQ